MEALRAQVKNGRLVLDEPTDLPEGEVVYLVAANDEDEMDDEERAELDAALDESLAQAERGEVIAGAEALRRLRSER